jgi:hypothetical protein
LLSISQGTPTIASVLGGAVSASDSPDTLAAVNGTAFGLSSASVDVTTYWPGALSTFNYNGYVRITNTGSVAAPVSAQHINPTTGAVQGTPVVIISSLAAGQSVLMSSVAIDALVGAAPSNLTSGRLRITAPAAANALRVQSLLQTGSDSPIEYTQVNAL